MTTEQQKHYYYYCYFSIVRVTVKYVNVANDVDNLNIGITVVTKDGCRLSTPITSLFGELCI